jgi:hypothetical protein
MQMFNVLAAEGAASAPINAETLATAVGLAEAEDRARTEQQQLKN